MIAVDQLSLAQAANLVVDHAEDAVGLPGPDVPRARLVAEMAPTVGDQHARVALPRRFEPEVVVDAAVGEHDARRERRVGGCRSCPVRRRSRARTAASSRSSTTGERNGGNADEAATATRQLNGGALDLADAVVPAGRASRSARGLPTGGSSR